MPGDTLNSILGRLVEPSAGTFSPSAAEALLELQFGESDHDRLRELALRSNQGILLPEEAIEYDSYIAAADLLAMLKAKARRSQKQHPSAA